MFFNGIQERKSNVVCSKETIYPLYSVIVVNGMDYMIYRRKNK